MSSFETDISPSIFRLERRSKAQNIGNTNDYIAGILNFPYHFLQLKKFVATQKLWPFEIF